MAEARRLYPDFEITRSWALPDIPPLPDEDLGRYLTRLGFSEAQLEYTRRSYGNATGEALPFISAEAALADMRDTTSGAGDYRILDGYDSIYIHLARGLDIRLNTPVTRIEWSPDGARVITAQESFEAEAVVITVPLGTLQAGMIEFAPALPESKQQAIGHLKMGPGIKLIYRFAEPFTAPETMALYSALNPPMWWSPANGHGTSEVVWTAFCTGDWARALLALGEEGALMKALDTLRAEFNRPDLQPVDMRLVNWPADPYIRGGYSVTPPGAVAARAELARPVANRLFWAGEATAPLPHIATVHGAYLSGERAAQEVLAAHSALAGISSNQKKEDSYGRQLNPEHRSQSA
jgi:monoamine oxidase